MSRPKLPKPTARQHGVVLVISLVILLMMTLVAVGVIRLSTRHTQVVNNEQVRTEAVSAANYALDMVINEPVTTWTDLKTVNGRVEYVNLGTQTTAEQDATSLGVTVKNLTCKRARVLKNVELVKQAGGVSYVEPQDSSCVGGASSTGLTIYDPSSVGSTSGDSNCGVLLYDVEANVADPKLLNATAQMVQGVEVRTDISSLSSSCD